jgi:hypothetical protein
MTQSRAFLKYTRLTHLYFGVFIAPALIFFAFTGALQTFSLHETTRGSSYKPPAWATTLAQIHKKQTPIVPVRKSPPPERSSDRAFAAPAPAAPAQSGTPTPAPSPAPTPAPRTHNAIPLKIFFLVVSIGLFVSTLSGLYMSYKYVRNKVLITVTLIAGTVLPVILAMV